MPRIKFLWSDAIRDLKIPVDLQQLVKLIESPTSPKLALDNKEYSQKPSMAVVSASGNVEAMEGKGTPNLVDKPENKYWSHQSSPDSSPEVEPLVANILATINGPSNHLQHLESPEPDDPDDVPSADQQLKEDGNSSKPVSFRDDDRPPFPGTSEERLLQMPEVRALPWREGVDPASENLVGGDSRRKQIKFGCLLATRGEVQKVPCSTCTNGRGKFSLCIALEGFFKGACASCQLSGGPNRCSIKQQDDEDGSPEVRSSDNIRKSSAKSTKRPSSREGSQPKQVKKRRKTTDAIDQGPKWDSTRPQWRQEPGQVRPQPSVVQSPWASSQQPNPHNTTLPPMSQALSSNGSNGYRNPAYHPLTPQPQPPHDRQLSSNNSPRPAPERRISGGWSAVNNASTPQNEQPPPIHHSHYMPVQQQSSQPQPNRQSYQQPPPPQMNYHSQQPQYHQSPYPVPPSNQQNRPLSDTHSHSQPLPPQHYSPYGMQPPGQHPPPQNPASNSQPPQQQTPSNNSLPNGTNTPPSDQERKDILPPLPNNGAYIDSLPTAKQRQLYGIVTGIQGGIKHLQSELETLKRALGMEEGI